MASAYPPHRARAGPTVTMVTTGSGRAMAAGSGPAVADVARRRPANAVRAAAAQARRRRPVAARVRGVSLEEVPGRRAGVAVIDLDLRPAGRRAHEPPQRSVVPPPRRHQRQPERLVGDLGVAVARAQARLESAVALERRGGAVARRVVAHEVLREPAHARVAVGDALADRAVLRLPRLADARDVVREALDPELGEVDRHPLADGAGVAGSRE